MAHSNTPAWEHNGLIHGWWVIPGQLLAGEYPGAKEPQKAAEKIRTLLDAGIDSFVDLTEAGESTWGGAPMVPYSGGKGRTGTVVGAWLIDQDGLGYPQVLDRMQELRTGTRKAGQRVPDTHEQAEVLKRRAQRKAA